MSDELSLTRAQKVRGEKLGNALGVAEKKRDDASAIFEGDELYSEYTERHARKTHWLYGPLLLVVVGLEWMINYASFLAFLNVPMFAAGSTILVAGIVAWASHVHGTLTRQPLEREKVTPHHERHDSGKVTIFIVASVLLLLAFFLVGGTRYFWIKDLSELGVAVSVWPKVGMTVITNVLVWAGGGFVAYHFHSEGQYTKLQNDYEKAQRAYEIQKEKFDRFRSKLVASRPDEQKEELQKRTIEWVKNAYADSAYANAMLLCAFAMVFFGAAAEAQLLGGEYDIDQFCADENVAAAAPFRRTVVYIDQAMVVPSGIEPAPSSPSEQEDWQRSLAVALSDSDWYQQLEAKLRASLLPSEHVSVVGVAAHQGATHELAEFCWPGYSRTQQLEIESRGFLRFFESDPIDDLKTQRQVAFARIRQAIAERMSGSAPTATTRQYVKALSRDEGRLRSQRGDFVRAIWHAGMIEESEYGSIAKTNAPRELAKQAVERTSLRLGGAAFHVYGVEDGGLRDKAQTFWEELINAGGGYLATFGRDLALVGEVPEAMHELRLEIEVPSPGKPVRRGRAALLVAQGGEIVDGSVVVAGAFRSALGGVFTCEAAQTACAASCALRAETKRSVLFKSLPHETIELDGTAGDLRGYIGEPDEGGANSAHAAMTAKTAGCEEAPPEA